jgi:hypothetical protein
LQLQQPPELLTQFKRERERERERAGLLKKLREESLPVESGRSKNQQERGERKPRNFSSDWILRFWGKEKAPLSRLSVLAEGGSRSSRRRKRCSRLA